MILPASHPQRLELNDEVHARPPEAMAPSLRISYLALLNDPARRDAAVEPGVALAQPLAAAPPLPGPSHFSADFGPFRLKWESHTEFHRIMIFAPLAKDVPVAVPGMTAVTTDWVASPP